MCDLLIFQVPSPGISIVIPIVVIFFPAALLNGWRVAGDGEKLNEYFKAKLLSSQFCEVVL